MKGRKLMKKERNKKIYIILLILGLISFNLQVFVFSYPDGWIGFLLCLCSTTLIIGSITKLCQLSKKFRAFLADILYILFYIF